MSDWNQTLRQAGRRSVPWIAGASLLGAAVWSAYTPAQGDPAQSAVWSEATAEELQVRLAYVSQTWDEVLADVAEKTGSTLVMHDVPPGRFSRTDVAKYPRREAVQILNRELEPLGYRLLEKDEFLTVMQIKRTRREYQRPIATTDAIAPVQAPVGLNRPAPYTGPQPEARVPAPNASTPHTYDGYRQANRRRDPLVRPVEYQSMAADPSGSTIINPRARTAVDIAKQIHKAFGPRSQLIDAGPNGMPAFEVAGVPHPDQPSGIPRNLFTVEIDTDENELHVSGSPEIQYHISRLIQQLDVSPISDQVAPTLMVGNGQTAHIAKQLQRPLQEIAASNAALPPGGRGLPQMDLSNGAMLFAQAPPAQPQPGQPGQPGQPAQPADPNVPPVSPLTGRSVLEANIGNLRGDVQIEAVEDLDILIIRGNTEDVEKVMAVIRQIEQLAVGSLPEIHLLKLQHVDSQSLAALLTDVYEQLSELRNRNAQQSQASVAVIPVVTPNAVLILAPGNAMDSVLSLADELDQPVDPSLAIQVYRLKHAIAEDVVTILQEFFEEEPTGLGARIKVSAEPRTNSIVIQAQPSDMAQLLTTLDKIDKDEAVAATQFKIFPLKSASAAELALFLNAAIQSVADPRSSTIFNTQGGQGGFGGAQQTQTNQTPKSVVLEFLAEDGQRLLRSGLLSDIRFNSEPRTNSLSVAAPAQSMPLIEELINILDKPSTAIAEVKYFPLRNADAIDAVTLLDELFQTDQQQTNQQNQGGTLGVNLMGTNDISNLVPLRFSADTRSNSVVAYGGDKALIAVEAILIKLDSASTRNRRTEVRRLRNSQADSIATAINDFLQSRRDLLLLDEERVSISELLQQEYVVTSEPTTNSLIISSTPEYLEQILQLVDQLDAEPNQVMIQALIVEVTLDNTDEFGIELGFQDTTLFDRSVTTAGALIPGFNFNNNALGGANVRSNQLASQGLSSFALGRVNTELGYGGLVLSASSENVSILVRALAARRELRVLSRPQVLALDNYPASIQVAQEVPVVTGVNQTNFGFTQNVTRLPAGIIMDVTPRVSPDGQIFMSIQAEKSFFDLDNGVPIFTDGATGNTVTSPIKNLSQAITTVKVPDGQTVVLGGLITQDDTVTERKVPWLGDIPVAGHLFRFDSASHVRTELLIFLTPRVIRGPGDFEYVKQVEADRMHWFQDEAEAVHGPIFGVPPEMAMPAGMDATYPLPEFDPYGSLPGETMMQPEALQPGLPDGHSFDEDPTAEPTSP